jgi:hypothetical protein
LQRTRGRCGRANLERVCGGNKLPLERLFLDLATVTRQLGKIPSKAEFAQMGKHSDTPLKTWFGSGGKFRAT